jgi:hypothetical protein
MECCHGCLAGQWPTLGLDPGATAARYGQGSGNNISRCFSQRADAGWWIVPVQHWPAIHAPEPFPVPPTSSRALVRVAIHRGKRLRVSPGRSESGCLNLCADHSWPRPHTGNGLSHSPPSAPRRLNGLRPAGTPASADCSMPPCLTDHRFSVWCFPVEATSDGSQSSELEADQVRGHRMAAVGAGGSLSPAAGPRECTSGTPSMGRDLSSEVSSQSR